MKGKNEMEFSYENLRNSFQNKNSIGEFWNRDVYVISKDNLCDVDDRYVYVVYDYHNQVIMKDGPMWYLVGELRPSGKVEMRGRRQPYYIPTKPVFTKEKPQELPVAAETNVSINMDVEEMLKAARAMTVSSLLDGFNYGLE